MLFRSSVPFRNSMKNWIKNSEISNFFEFNINLFFFSTLEDKVEAIRNSNLGYYIDDLLKVFKNNNYPKHIVSFLYKADPENISWLKVLDDFANLRELI